MVASAGCGSQRQPMCEACAADPGNPTASGFCQWNNNEGNRLASEFGARRFLCGFSASCL